MTTATRSRVQALRARARQPGEASFFFHDAHFACDAVKVLPGEYYVADDCDLVVTTTLGSCVAVCLWDPTLRMGGMNHIMLPEGSPGDGEAAGRYGSFAMELLINALMRRGALRTRLQAKVFGGGAVVAGMHSLNVGERNARFALDYLATERIAVLAQDLLERFPRKVAFWPATGKAMVKRLPDAQSRELVERERDAAQRPAAPVAAGSVDLF
jgi:chemotaxis protein CheD